MAKIKNVLSLVLVFAMLLTMASFPAFAADVPEADRAEAKTHTLVPNATGDKFTVANGEEVLVGDKIVLPYVNTRNPQPETLLKGGAPGAAIANSAAHAASNGNYGLEGLYENIFVYGEIGGVTYTPAQGSAYINSKAKEGELNGAESTWAVGLAFTVTEVGTYNFQTKHICADANGDGVYGKKEDGDCLTLDAAFDCVDPITVSRKLKVEPTYAKKTVNLVYDESKNMYTVPEGVTVRVGDTIKWNLSQMFTYTKLDGTDAQQKALYASGLGAFHISLDENDGKFTRTEGKTYSNYKWKGDYNEQDLQLQAGYLVITKKGLYAGAKEYYNKTVHYINPVPEGDPVYVDWYKTDKDGVTVEKDCLGVWLEPFKVTQVADDYANVAPTSNEVLEVPAEELFIGENATEFTLSFRVKMANDVEPEFTYSVAPTSEDITPIGAISGGGYEYAVDAKFPISGTSGDAVTVKVTWGDNFLCEEREYATFTRELSDKLFGAEFLEGENRLAVSTTNPALNANVLISVTTQKIKEGVTSAVVDGVTYTNLEIKLAEVKSSGNRFNDFTAEDFYYDVFTDTTRYLATAKKSGIDMFTAKLELVGYDAVAKKNVTLETVTLTTDMITIPEKAAANTGITIARVVGTTKVPQLIAQLQEVYADHNYVIVDCRNEYLVDINGTPILDEQNQPIANLAYRKPGDKPEDIIVTAELWNALIHMNKAYIEFRMHAAVTAGGNAYAGQILNYNIKIDKKNTSLLLESKEELFRVGMVYGKAQNDKVTGSYVGVLNGIKEQLGNGYEPFPFRVSWWVTGLPFTDAEVSLQIPEEWAKKNGYKDLSIYKYSPLSEGGIGTLSLYQDGLAVNNRTEYMLTIPMSSDPSYFYGNYVLVGADLTVERNNDTTGKNNAATGGADMVATFAIFAVIALAGVALKKRED